ncbi:hypothetical protein M9H77_29554 [Catharanthus roseus]|uniref:Uncharacterized protein n=1 Tax=Catharanthus roseus TaxID=4058 RepID=A0ACB9ZXC6_CATRO|nr:hypothetical protein M9H77_29554 [Catharanthus roseus]
MNLVPRSHKSINELMVIDIYLIDKPLSTSSVNLPCIIIHSMRDPVSTNKKHRVFSYPLLLMDIFQHFEIDVLGEEQGTTTSSDIINRDTISRSNFEYIEIEKRWIARLGLSLLEDFGHQGTKPDRCPKKAVAEEEEDDDTAEKAEASDAEYDESDSSIRATLEQMQIRQA